MLVNCQYCNLKVEKNESIRYKDKNFHKECQVIFAEREELLEYICKLFDFKAPGPLIYKQIKSFLEKYPYYTHKGILLSLIYFHEIKRNPIRPESKTIGIVPYIYDEAQSYYNSIEKKQDKAAATVDNFIKKEKIVRKVTISDKEKKGYDLELIE